MTNYIETESELAAKIHLSFFRYIFFENHGDKRRQILHLAAIPH